MFLLLRYFVTIINYAYIYSFFITIIFISSETSVNLSDSHSKYISLERLLATVFNSFPDFLQSLKLYYPMYTDPIHHKIHQITVPDVSILNLYLKIQLFLSCLYHPRHNSLKIPFFICPSVITSQKYNSFIL